MQEDVDCADSGGHRGCGGQIIERTWLVIQHQMDAAQMALSSTVIYLRLATGSETGLH